MKKYSSLASLVLLIATATLNTTALAAPKLLINQHNVYSPVLISHNGQQTMFYSGWKDPINFPADPTSIQDKIYRATCSSANNCTYNGPVLDAGDFPNIQALADPSVVKMVPGIHVMYMTGYPPSATKCPPPNQGFFCPTAPEHNIYISYSFNNSMTNWSTPQVLKSGFWIPSVTKVGYNFYLFATDGNQATHNRIKRFNLGPFGNAISGAGVPIKIRDSINDPFSLYYFERWNHDVVYRPSINLYQIFTSRLLSLAPNSSSRIDYLDSSDGINWTVREKDIVSPSNGNNFVGTPAPHPQSHFEVYYGQSPAYAAGNYDIWHTNWTTN